MLAKELSLNTVHVYQTPYTTGNLVLQEHFEHPTYRRKLAIRNNLLYKDSHKKYYVQIPNDIICHIYNLIGPILSSG